MNKPLSAELRLLSCATSAVTCGNVCILRAMASVSDNKTYFLLLIELVHHLAPNVEEECCGIGAARVQMLQVPGALEHTCVGRSCRRCFGNLHSHTGAPGHQSSAFAAGPQQATFNRSPGKKHSHESNRCHCCCSVAPQQHLPVGACCEKPGLCGVEGAVEHTRGVDHLHSTA